MIAVLPIVALALAGDLAQRDAQCLTALNDEEKENLTAAHDAIVAEGKPRPEAQANACRILVSSLSDPDTVNAALAAQRQAIADELTRELDAGIVIAPADVEPLATSAPDASGLAQPFAAQSVQPCALAGAGTSISGTQEGPRFVISGCVNVPAIVTRDDVDAYDEWSRIFDLSFVVPIDTAALQRPGANPFVAIGGRVRINALGAWSDATAAMKTLETREFADTRAKLSMYAAADRDYTLAVEELLEGAPDLAACAKDVREGKYGSACGDVDADATAADAAAVVTARADLSRAMARAREELDRAALGIDLRFDYGDVDDSDDARRNTLVSEGGIAGHYRYDVGKARLTGRARVGGGFTSFATSVASRLVWGAALDVGTVFQNQELRGSIGADGRHAFTGIDAVNSGKPEQVIDVRVGVEVPLTTGGSFTLGMMFPASLDDVERAPVFLIGGDWLSLLADAL